MNILFHSGARKELFEAAEYYEEQVVGLGEIFSFSLPLWDNLFRERKSNCDFRSDEFEA